MNLSRRQARIFAMQSLYALEVAGGTLADVLPSVLESLEPTLEQRKYGVRLAELVLEHKETLQLTLAQYATDWDPARMPILDRIVIWLAMAELSHCASVPTKVVLQEAVQIVRKYSTGDSGNFVNGVLDRFARDRNMLKESPLSPEILEEIPNEE